MLRSPKEYDQDTDTQGRLVIELRIDRFKALDELSGLLREEEHILEIKKKEEMQAKELRRARTNINEAAAKGEIEELEKAQALMDAFYVFCKRKSLSQSS